MDFAEVLSYPSSETSKHAANCSSLLEDSEASHLMNSFSSYLGSHSLGRVSEVYTRTFDLQPSCSPYVGDHLFGDGYRRGEFLVRLKERCAECGIDFGNELPDHISVILRLLAHVEGTEAVDLIDLCLSPALGRMLGSLNDDRNPYNWALQALSRTIRPPQIASPLKREMN
jgi:nitrate reductase delta subunit